MSLRYADVDAIDAPEATDEFMVVENSLSNLMNRNQIGRAHV